MIVFPTSLQQAAGETGVVRAGGTDLHERRRLRLADGPVVDLRDVAEAREIAVRAGGEADIGALVKIAALAADPRIVAGYPALAEAAGGLATPQIRAIATVAGNLLQRNRCWYYRAPEANCLKKGGDRCAARAGDHLYHACFDLGPCVSVHPSTLATALLAYDASVEIVGGAGRTVAALLGDGHDSTRDHALEAGALVSAIVVPAPRANERSAYVRTISRARAEWPLVEAVARLGVEKDAITWAAVSVGGVAPVPLRLATVEKALVGQPARDETFPDIAALARERTEPLPMTGYKVDLLEATVLEVLERALARTAGGAT
ncbi:MAG TPA: FAD binding domain-containing protein [Nannocystaceae bacterium]|nr:FAD binding domain-containing protein [Nannocystaceae bacterium]